MTIKDSEGIVYLNEEQYTLLKLNGKLVIDGITIEYSPLTTSYAVKDTRTLLAPKAAPLQNQIVAVNEEGKQQMLNVGDGLNINDSKLQIDDNITTKLAKTLITPMATPISTELVAVDNTGSQKMLELGDGLSVENGTLKASGGKLYRHNIWLSTTNTYFTIINKDSTALSTVSLLSTALSNVGTDYSTNKYISASGFIADNNTTIIKVAGIASGASIKLYGYTLNIDNGTLTNTIYDERLTSATIYDTVTEL